MIINLAWRNVWRNKTRSVVMVLALAIGLLGSIFIAALGNGMVNNWVQTAIDLELSDIKIHREDYLIMEELNMTMVASPIMSILDTMKNVKSYSSRVRVDGMAMTANNVQQVTLFGIDPGQENIVSTISENITEGSFFDSLGQSKPIIISQRLANKLKVRMRSKIIFTLADVNGEIAYQNFKVTGIFKTNNSMFDQVNVFVLKEDLSRILKIEPGQCHEIAIRVNDELATEATSLSLSEILSNKKVRSWKDQSPTLDLVNSTMGMYNYILIGIVLIALVFGIVNTMLMVILERTKEIGMLRSLGMRRKKIAYMITLETIFLCLVGAVVGNFLSYGMVQFFSKAGVHLDVFAEGIEQYGMSSSIYPTLEPAFYFNITAMVVFTAIFSSIFPIVRAFKLDPASAIRD